MKKIIVFLITVLIFVISLGIFINSESSFMKIFYKEFDTTVNIVANPENIEKNIIDIQEIANKNNISLIKETYKPKKTRYGKQKLSLYIFLNDGDWFEEKFKDINIVKNTDSINKFKQLENISILTTKEVDLLPFSKIDKSYFNGDYHIKGSQENIRNFLEDLDTFKLEAKVDESFSIASEYTQKQFFLYIVSTLILITSIIFCLVIYNGSLSKEIAIIDLLGYDKRNYCFNKTMRMLHFPILASFILITVILYILTDPHNINGYIFSLRKIYGFMIITFLVLFILEFIMLLFKANNVNIVLWLKGYRKNYNRSSIFVKTISVSLVLYLMVVSFLGLVDYLHLKPYIATRERTKNYANIACSWPWSYVKDDEKFQEAVVPELNNLWNELEDNGAILFDAPNAEQEGILYDEDYVDKQVFHGKFAYINNNFLKLAQIIDINGEAIKDYKACDGEWIIFVPENINVSVRDKKIIKENHTKKLIDKKNIAKEKYVQVKKDQNIFSFDSQKKLDDPDTKNYVLIMVNGKELEPTGSIKLPSLVNGKFHPYISNEYNRYDNLQSIIEETESQPYVLYITSVYDEAVSKIELFRIESFIYMIGLFLALLILGVLLEIDKESYLYNHGQRIDVSRLLGYEFIIIHKKKILQNLTSYVGSIILLILIVLLTTNFSQYGFFTPRDGWGKSELFISLLISFICIIMCFLVEINKLKNIDKSIGTRLKEGC